MEVTLKLNDSPNISNMSHVEAWLIEEMEATGEGFYNNLEIIDDSFQKKQILTLDQDGESIAFVTWRPIGVMVGIEICVLHPNLRKQGIGKYFVTHFLDYFRAKGFIAAKLHASPASSSSFWEAMGFKSTPSRGFSEPQPAYHLAFVEPFQPCLECNLENKLELWNVEPHKASQIKPNWTWDLSNISDQLPSPIFLPVSQDWNLRLTRNGNIIREEKVKYFWREEDIYPSFFLYLTHVNFS